MVEKIFIKNMVCNRCVMAVESTLKKLDIEFEKINLGEAVLKQKIDDKKLSELENELEKIGFEILNDNDKVTIEKIKNIVIEEINKLEGDERNINFSKLLSDKLTKSYNILSKLFSSVEGITIEKYIINQKIEKVKELISYNEMNFSEIAFALGYSSSSHLSRQFKQITGMTLSEYKNMRNKTRKPLDEV